MKFFAVLFSLTYFFLAGGTVARAQGVIVPIVCDVRPCRPIPRPIPLPNALPVKSIKLDTKIANQVATTHVEQVFRNDTPYTLEGTYFFPIPEGASISEFAIWENGKKLVGEVRSREEARRIYDAIVRRQRDPGLLEYAGQSLLQASIFPIPPNSDKKLELTYTQVLKADSGTVAYRYPLGTGHNLWRQGPIAVDGPVPPSVVRRGVSPQQQFGTISGTIEIEARNAVRNIYSPTHTIDIKNITERSAKVSFETSGSNKDLELFYSVSDDDFGLSLITHREAGKDGYFMLQLSPKAELRESEIANKDIVFVIDTSGSMADEGKMDKARAGLLFGIRGLREGDRFNVINFAGEEHLMESGLIKADDAGKKRGVAFVEALRPSGGTNINDALKAGLRQFDSSNRPKMMVFMTDGLPTVGVQKVDEILKNAAAIKVPGLHLFNFGVGYDVNTRLLDKLAAENSGVADYIQPKEDIEVKVSKFFAKVNSPVMTGIELDLGSIEADLVYPRNITDLFRGDQLTLIGRYKNGSSLSNAVVKLTGTFAGKRQTFTYNGLDLPVRNEDNSFLARLWANRRVGWLVEQVRNNGENKELRDEIVDLGTRYGIVTPYTSYLATDGSFQLDGASGSGNGALRPQDSMAAVARQRNAAPPAPMSVSGKQAVTDSLRAQEARDKKSLAEDEEKAGAPIRRVDVKTFYLFGEAWTDSEFDPKAGLPELKVKFGSDEYFDLVTKTPELAKYLSLGEQVVIVWKGTVYKIVK
ncbi:MAG: von Willebrand factor type A [Acidobacteria bacterium OLB17]|nr:MAG: von Willebrand factor type A [Acidobacteria bacterium OLB17]MCZ2389524.1 VIT and VWA domain-containing protein [Acidobacteriota bacterium]